MKTTRLLLALLLAVPLYGQTISGSITTSSSDCSIGAACISLPLPTNAAAATLQVAGTYTGTLQFELTSDAKGCLAAPTSFVNVSASPLPSGAAASSTTSTGTWRTNSAGGTCLRIRASAFASGSATVTLNYGTGSASSGAGGGSSATFDTLASGTNTSAAMVVGTGASLAASGSGTIAATSLAGLTGTLHQVPVGSGGALADSTGLSESYPTFTVNESQTTNGTQAVIGDVKTTQLTAPSTLACVQGAATGGFLLHNQAYFYKVTAISANGQTTVSNESTFTTGALPAPDTYTASCTWTGHTGDTGYKLYRATTTGNEVLLATITPGNVNSYTDNTNVVPAGAMPTVNSTGTLTAAGQIIGNASQSAAAPALSIGPLGTGFYNDGFGNLIAAVNGVPANLAVETNKLDLLGTSSNLTFNLDSFVSRNAASGNFGFGKTAGATDGTLTAAQFTGGTKTGIYNFNQAAQSQAVTSATEYYIARSDLDMPAAYTTAIAAGTTMRWRIALTKTAAGTGTFQILLKKGTNGSTADTSIVTQTIGTQTAVVDNMEVDILLNWTSATAAYWTMTPRQSAASGTGFGLVYPATAAQFSGTISAQTTTTASDKYGVSLVFTTGTPTFVVTSVQAQAFGVN